MAKALYSKILIYVIYRELITVEGNKPLSKHAIYRIEGSGHPRELLHFLTLNIQKVMPMSTGIIKFCQEACAK